MDTPPAVTFGLVVPDSNPDSLAQAAVQAASSAHDACMVTLTPVVTVKSDSNPCLTTFTVSVTDCAGNPTSQDVTVKVLTIATALALSPVTTSSRTQASAQTTDQAASHPHD